ncbi:putative major capsid protein [Nitrincola phage 1M3-16]|uniref:major head protein n=1 Tax=Nitrincola phage 1M3-16 TaxID=1472912 RepID=UPI000444BF08|nr:major head protein [Nitrincola phage 1M3-16]AHX01196.1 putative major capsid protein [Nitrincola phage 1M3-16]
MAYTQATFVIYDEQYFSGVTEVLSQAAVEMAAAGGVMRIGTRLLKGQLDEASFFQNIDNLVSDRNPDDLSAADFSDLTMSQTRGVKTHRSSKVEKTVNAFKALGESPELMSFVLGRQHAKAFALDYTNTGIASVAAALESLSGATLNVSAESGAAGQLNVSNLVKLRAKMGDNASAIRAWVMHSQAAHKLLGDAVASQVDSVAGVAIYRAEVGSLGLPIIVTDSPYLVEVNSTTGDIEGYKVLGLTESAVLMEESEEQELLTRLDDTKKNITARITVETAYTVNVKGFAWDGSTAPTKADLADSGNWDYVYASVKQGPGVLGIFAV